VIQSYEILPKALEYAVAVSFPWLELILGIFCFLGLWIEWTAKGILIFFTTFIIVVGQALIRKLPISECGCFGELISFPLQTVFAFDSLNWLATACLILKSKDARKFSLDGYYSQGQ
jgi:hypothetical protein